MKADIWEFYNKEYESSKTFVPAHQYQYAPQWKHLVTPDHPSPPRVTGTADLKPSQALIGDKCLSLMSV
ncbi:hypothetical protein ETH_00039870 [Eimeria tenella]|uniref:Uncharacterized protein n=1 Tax=Eimeria tenella TaxID=5802 RepID=U6KPI5_EIMTE|nr:hypothetical protein ETH_00039870 [Eimeria tenella]CDJ40012.1 hypothetical protein ETH_00039870 [Eimeria tenella]|eukprot:XP_013230765.1 hypothetical protein ETH_00039870 [Eimeria tenella]